MRRGGGDGLPSCPKDHRNQFRQGKEGRTSFELPPFPFLAGVLRLCVDRARAGRWDRVCAPDGGGGLLRCRTHCVHDLLHFGLCGFIENAQVWVARLPITRQNCESCWVPTCRERSMWQRGWKRRGSPVICKNTIARSGFVPAGSVLVQRGNFPPGASVPLPNGG